MAYGGSLSAPGPRGWGFMPTGPCQAIALAASTVTVTLNQFVTTARYAPQVAFCNIGAAAANSHAFVAFGSSTVTVAATTGVVLAALAQKLGGQGTAGSPYGGYEILTTGKSPTQYLAVGSAGTTTVYITPGEGSR